MPPLRCQKGFNLIELMVTVAIVGVLSSIASTRYEVFQRKSLQAEAKIYLAAAYAGQKAFYAEYSAYIPSHAAVGYTPEGFKRYYEHRLCETDNYAGTISGYAATIGTGNGHAFFLTQNTPFTVAYAYEPGNGCATLFNNCSSLGNDPQLITPSAIGKLCPTCYDDAWTITMTKRLRNCSNGTRAP